MTASQAKKAGPPGPASPADSAHSVSPVASQRIAAILAERILSGVLKPGARIKQDELATELRASRIPVREALRILESRGLVRLRSNSGAWVTDMSLRDLELSYQIRERIEPLLLQESVPNLAVAHVERMRVLQDDIESSDDVERFLVLDREFHWVSYAGAEAPQLAAMVERLWDTTQHYRRAFTRMAGRERAWVINSEHRLLIDAVAGKHLDNAATILGLHIRRTRLELVDHPELFRDQ